MKYLSDMQRSKKTKGLSPGAKLCRINMEKTQVMELAAEMLQTIQLSSVDMIRQGAEEWIKRRQGRCMSSQIKP